MIKNIASKNESQESKIYSYFTEKKMHDNKNIYLFTYSAIHVVDGINCRPRICESNKTIALAPGAWVVDYLKKNQLRLPEYYTDFGHML